MPIFFCKIDQPGNSHNASPKNCACTIFMKAAPSFLNHFGNKIETFPFAQLWLFFHDDAI